MLKPLQRLPVPSLQEEPLTPQGLHLSLHRPSITVFYLACVSTLHIASTTIMQFTAFNSSSILTMKSAMALPNATALANGTW